MPGQGRFSKLRIAPEATFGTNPVGAFFGRQFEIIRCRVDPVKGEIPDPSLNNSVGRRAVFGGGILYRGSFLIRTNYQGLQLLFQWVFRRAPIYTSVTADRSWDAVFKDSDSELAVYSMAIWMGQGNIPATQGQRLNGAICTRLLWRTVAGQGPDAMFQCEFDVLAKQLTTGIAEPATAPISTGTYTGTSGQRLITAGTAQPQQDGVVYGDIVTGHASIPAGTYVIGCSDDTTVRLSQALTASLPATALTFTHQFIPIRPTIFHHATVVDDGVDTDAPSGSTGIRVRTLECEYVVPHAEDRFYLGSKNIDVPLPNDFVSATYRFTQEFRNVNHITALIADTNASPNIKLVSPDQVDGTNFFELEFKSEKALVVEQSTPVEGYGIILVEHTVRSYMDPTLGTFWLRNRSDQNSV